MTALTNTFKIPIEEFVATNLQAFLDDLGCKLVHAVLDRVAKNVVDGTATISRSTVFADMLDAPVPELAMSNHVNACKNLINAWTLYRISSNHQELSINV
jgi:hypothetical protein